MNSFLAQWMPTCVPLVSIGRRHATVLPCEGNEARGRRPERKVNRESGVPFYCHSVSNSGGRIVEVVANIVSHCRAHGMLFELLVVDDGSDDDEETRATFATAQRAHRELRGLRDEPNRGKGYSIRRAYAECAGTHVCSRTPICPTGSTPSNPPWLQ